MGAVTPAWLARVLFVIAAVLFPVRRDHRDQAATSSMLTPSAWFCGGFAALALGFAAGAPYAAGAP